MGKLTPGCSDRAAHLLTSARLFLNSPPEAPKSWGQANPNRNEYHSDPNEISSTFWLPDITYWWHQREEPCSMYAGLSNVARNLFSIIPHGVRVEACFSLGQVLIGWRQSKPIGETLCQKVVVRQYARADNGILAGIDSVLHTTEAANDIELNREAEERKLHRMANVHNLLQVWHDSQNLHATQKESHARHKQMSAIGYISDTEEIINASWTNCQLDGAAAFKLSQRSP